MFCPQHTTRDEKKPSTSELVDWLRALQKSGIDPERIASEIPLTGEDFVTAFNKRVFDAVMALHKREGGFRLEFLGEDFSPDEIGRMQKYEMTRRRLTQNGPEVFRSAVEVLRDVKKKETAGNGDLHDRIAYLREKQAKLHKGKVDKP